MEETGPCEAETTPEASDISSSEAEISPDKEQEVFLDAADLIKNDLFEFSEVLAESPEITGQIHRVMSRQLNGPITRDTYERLMMSLCVLVGKPSARLIGESSKILSKDFFEDLTGKIDGAEEVKPAIRFLQHITSMYGHQLKSAFILSFRHTIDDWKNADISAYRKGDGELWFIEMDITKYSGETVYLRMPPLSAVQLANLLLSELQKIPSELVDPEITSQIRKSADSLDKGMRHSPGARQHHHIDGYA
jgi:hypothetical protein